MFDGDGRQRASRYPLVLLRWAEGWVVTYPTWMYGVPAMLKGWLDRVWLPGVAFRLSTTRERTISGGLGNIRWFVGITTSGAPWWWLKYIGDPGRSRFMKGLRPLYARGCKMKWLQLSNIKNASARGAPAPETVCARRQSGDSC